MTGRNTPNRCSVSEAARWIGCARQTLTAWLFEAGMDQADGVDVPAFLKWKFVAEREAGRAEIRRKFAQVERTIDDAEAAGLITEDEAKRRKLVAQMTQEEIKAAEMGGEMTRTDEVAEIVRTEYAKVRGSLSLLPANIDYRLAKRSQDECRVILDEAVRSVLGNLQADARYELEGGHGDSPAVE